MNIERDTHDTPYLPETRVLDQEKDRVRERERKTEFGSERERERKTELRSERGR